MKNHSERQFHKCPNPVRVSRATRSVVPFKKKNRQKFENYFLTNVFFLMLRTSVEGHHSDGALRSMELSKTCLLLKRGDKSLSPSTGAVPWRHTLGSWLWRAGHAGAGDRHAPRRRDTRLIVDEGLLN